MGGLQETSKERKKCQKKDGETVYVHVKERKRKENKEHLRQREVERQRERGREPDSAPSPTEHLDRSSARACWLCCVIISDTEHSGGLAWPFKRRLAPVFGYSGPKA